MWPLLKTLGVALAGAAVLTPVARKLSWHLGFLDQPAARKVHAKVTPLLGGAAVAAGMFLALAVAPGFPASSRPGPGTWLALSCALVLGLWDDRRGMGPIPKLAGQLLVGLCMLMDGFSAPLFGWAPANALTTLFWVVALMNAVNFLDNMDGIAAGIGAVAGIGFAALGWSTGSMSEALLGTALAGACLGFLFFNFSPASIFLGDAGSLLVGATLARLSLGAADSGRGVNGVLAALIVLAYPVFDITFVTSVRLLEGRKVYQGGRDHSSHRFGRLLKDNRRTALAVYLLSALLSVAGWTAFASVRVSVAWGLAAMVMLFFVGLGISLARVPVGSPGNGA